ncbi:hypothetical protein BAE44_0024136 [Dichanthelium oligosanthes]|uniref:Non-haem dioxygenase N-terminal domain-containing protein n=1 Tax=Dichanthelium oligosanthes TaxID=888268 RepID=A0A1E5UPQ1_9POAL|nr:hypothetical protein BAE44_0024136 [Dichanthelium oligosanthes]
MLFNMESGAGGGDGDGGRSELEGSYCLIKGVRHLSDRGFTRLPDRYVLPASERPGDGSGRVKLPVVDLKRLRDPCQRASEVEKLNAACRDYGFFQASAVHHIGSACVACFVSSVAVC